MSVRLCSVGDIMLGENVHHYGRGIPRRFHGRYAELISPSVRALLSDADCIIGNFECSILPDREWGAARMEKAIYSAPEAALSLLDSLPPVKILNVANNHIMQHGMSRARATIARLQERGIVVAGATFDPSVVECGGRRLWVWGVSVAHDPQFEPGGYAWSSHDDLPGLLNRPGEKKNEDVWIVSIHWGEEYRRRANAGQLRLAERLVAAGYDFVLGHHPHVIQPVTKLDSSWISYSHGNFIFDQNFSRMTREGLLLKIGIDGEAPSAHLLRTKGYRIQSAQPVVLAALNRQCERADHPRTPLAMRFKMKAEWLAHLPQSNTETIRYFASRFSRKTKGAA